MVRIYIVFIFTPVKQQAVKLQKLLDYNVLSLSQACLHLCWSPCQQADPSEM